MSLDDVRALVAAHRLGPDVAVPDMAGMPATDAGGADTEPLASLAAGRTRYDSGHHTLTQIDGQR